MSDRNNKTSRSNAEFQDAAKRLEEAVSDLMSSAGTRLTDGASKLLDDATNAIRNELSMNASAKQRGSAEDDSETSARRERHRRWSRELGLGTSEDELYGSASGDSQADWFGVRRRPGEGDSLQRDRRNGKIAGVCAGIARYYGVETWVVRCLAITGLLFMPQIVFPGYWIAYFVLGSDDTEPRRRSKQTRRRGRRGSKGQSEQAVRTAPPRARLRNAKGAFDNLEMRLRRMERHVTSGRYDLQRELGKIDDSAAPA